MAAEVSTEQAYAYAELLEILSFSNIELINRIPENILNLFRVNALPEYENHLEENIAIEKQEISRKTAALLVLLSLNFGTESDEEKEELRNLLNKNQKAKENADKKELPMDNSVLPWYKKSLNSMKNFIYKITKK